MNAGEHASESSRAPRLRGEMWIGPVCGLVGSIIAIIVWRRLHLPYRLEVGLALYMFISIGVTAYINGGWRAHPWRVLLLLILLPAVAAMLIHFAN